jgi:hypothetical protein
MNSPQQAPDPAAPGLRAQGHNWTRRLVNALVALVVIAVAGATFVFSYPGVHAIALLGGVSAQLARYYPGLFDAVLVIACVAAAVLRDGRWWARLWAWLVIIAVLGAIGTADVLHAMGYTLRHRPTEGIVAGAPIAAVLLAFSLLLTLLRQSRAHVPAAPVATPLDVPALPAAVSVLPIALPAASAVSPAAEPAQSRDVPEPQDVIDEPAATVAVPTAPVPVAPPTEPAPVPADGPVPEPADGPAPDVVPALPSLALAEASVASQDVAPGAAAVPDENAAVDENPAPDENPVLDEARAPEDVVAQKPHTPTEPNGVIPPAAPAVEAAPLPDEPAPPTVEVPAMTPPPVPPRSNGIRYAGGVRTTAPSPDYWDAEDTEQFAGLVYRASDDDDIPADASAARPNPPELDDDGPPFATAPFASMPRLNRVRSMPTPPTDEDE